MSVPVKQVMGRAEPDVGHCDDAAMTLVVAALSTSTARRAIFMEAICPAEWLVREVRSAFGHCLIAACV